MIGGHQKTSGWRLSVAALILATTVGCSGAVDGSPQKATPTYQPLPAATLTAAEIALPEDTWAVSTDASQILVRDDDDRWCVRPVAGGADTCLDLPDDARLGKASFSPDGAYLSLGEDLMLTMRGRMWVATVADGSVREVAPTPTGQPGPTQSTGSGSDGPLSSSDSRYYISIFDPQTGTLLAVQLGLRADKDALIRVDPVSGSSEVVALLETRFSGQIVAGGGVAVLGVVDEKSRPGDMEVVQESNGMVRSLGSQVSSLYADDAVGLPAAISADGTRLLVKSFDMRQATATAPAVVDLTGSAPPSPLSGFPEVPYWSAAFSPDGTQVIALVRNADDPRASQLMIWDGATARVVADAPGQFDPIQHTLAWSAADVVTPATLRGRLLEGSVAWQLKS